MKKSLFITVALAVIALPGMAFAAVSADEADQLGNKLTLWGAEKAGNAAGTIPAYAPLSPDTAPPGWVKGSGRYETSPYDNEKPLFSITAANMDKYAANLTAGQMELLKRYPSFRMDIYPTHRSIPWPSRETSFCKKNALNAKLTTPEGDGIANAFSCVPFPIPKNGYEVLWNSYVRPIGYKTAWTVSSFVVTAANRVIDVGNFVSDQVYPYHDPKRDSIQDVMYRKRIGNFFTPTWLVGQVSLIWTSSDYIKQDLTAWYYTPGQRRVRLTPNNAYDTPPAAFLGAMVYDELNGFDGRPDRWDIKLIGKTEKYIPYNNNRMQWSPIEKVTAKPFVVNPDLDRWELHRVWILEATLKPGKRHRDSRRTLYIDEDTWAIITTDTYDHANKMYRVGFFPTLPIWDTQTSSFQSYTIYDLNKREYFYEATNAANSKFVVYPEGKGRDLSFWTAASIESKGLR